MKVVYLAHPVAGDVQGNLESARRWIRWIYDHYPYVAVLANWILDCEILDDSKPVHREMGFEHNRAIIERCDEIWLVGGRISDGMSDEADIAASYSVDVIDLTALGPVQPDSRVDTDQYAVCWDCTREDNDDDRPDAHE